MNTDYKEYTNNELILEQKRLEDKYENIKKIIKEKYEELERLDKEYNKIKKEINMRKNIIF